MSNYILKKTEKGTVLFRDNDAVGDFDVETEVLALTNRSFISPTNRATAKTWLAEQGYAKATLKNNFGAATAGAPAETEAEAKGDVPDAPAEAETAAAYTPENSEVGAFYDENVVDPDNPEDVPASPAADVPLPTVQNNPSIFARLAALESRVDRIDGGAGANVGTPLPSASPRPFSLGAALEPGNLIRQLSEQIISSDTAQSGFPQPTFRRA
jgi:hypothetical protein